MAETLLEKLAAWNIRMNGIPRKGLLVAFTLFCAWLIIALFPYCWPFVVALLFSMILEPFVRLMTKGFGHMKAGRTIATLLGMLVLFGLVTVLLILSVNRLWQELVSLGKAIPSVIAWFMGTAIPWAQDLYRQYADVLPSYALDMLDNAIKSLGQTVIDLASSLSKSLTSSAWTTAMSLMDVILSVVLTIMGTYYMTADKTRIFAFFHRTFPRNVILHSNLIKTNLVRALFGQVKSQLKVSMIIISFLVLTFLIFGIPYGLLAGLIIGLSDALPVIGAGLFLIPWSIIGFVVGDLRTGAIMAGVYVGTVVIRQIFEPRIVGKSLGLYPLATMIAMFAGYQLLGAVGLLGGPVMLNVIKVVLEADKVASASALITPDTAPASPEAPAPAKPQSNGEITLRNGEKRIFRLKSK